MQSDLPTDHGQAVRRTAEVDTAFIPAADNGVSAALDYIRAAAQHVTKHRDGRVASWLYAVESEIQTNAGAHAAALIAIDRALETLDKPGPTGDLPWFVVELGSVRTLDEQLAALG